MKNRVLKIGLLALFYLLLGALVSLGFTWWSVKLHESTYTHSWIKLLGFPYFDQFANPSTTGRHLSEPNEFGGQWVVNGRINKRGELFQLQYDAGVYRDGLERPAHSGLIPEWSRVHSSPSVEEVDGQVFILEQVGGWPFRSWRGDLHKDSRMPGIVTLNSIPDTYRFVNPAWRDVVVFPYEPIFPGVFYNASIFGVIAYVALRLWRSVHGRVRDALRVQDLRCPECRYNCRGLTVCPECGYELGPDHPAIKQSQNP